MTTAGAPALCRLLAMALAPGSQVGAFHVTGIIGAGGMGQVYRAHDGRLKRDVALKVLPAATVADPASRARFAREAQLLAALNHPHIAQVFGVEESAGEPVIVMELVDGPTLADRLRGGALAVDEAMAIARQICDGLAAAHDAGIVHRDLKPANIKVRDDGSVKILDFGLARAFGDDTGVDATHSPTMLADRTAAGVVLGTAAYMSPEQARGRVVDRRADVWAFGCVLYEMLTGERAFRGETTTDILAAVIHHEPEWTRLPAQVPARVVELLMRCLAKPLKERQRDLGDARRDLEPVRTPASGAALSSSGVTAAPTAVRPARSWMPVAAAIAGAAAAAAVIVGVAAMRTAPERSRRPTRVSLTLPAGMSLALGRGSAIALSPDGRRLVFAGYADKMTRLYVRELDNYDARALPGTDGATNPFFSTDGRWVGFFAEKKLKKVALDGGAPVTIADAPEARGGVWTSDDSILFTPDNFAGLHRVPAAGGAAAEAATPGTGEHSYRWPTPLPDPGTVLFTKWNAAGWEPAQIVAEHLATHEQTVVVESGGGYGHYLADGDRGYLVFARQEGLLAAPFDAASARITGQAVPMSDEVITNLSGGAHFDISASGTLAYVPGASLEIDRALAWVALDGTATPAATLRQTGREFSLSPDGTRVARTNSSGANRHVWVDDLTQSSSTRVTTTGEHFMPQWSRDSRSLFFGGGYRPAHLFRRDLQTGAEVQLTSESTPGWPNDVAPDGTLAFTKFTADNNGDIWLLPGAATATSAPTPRAAVATPFSDTDAVFSPDGRWLAFHSNRSGRSEVYVMPLPDGVPAQVSTDGGFAPEWAASGREIFYRAPGGRMMQATAPEAGTPAPPRVLFDASGYESRFRVAPDGKRLLMMPLIAGERASTSINVVFDFIEELRQRVR
jgi:Tol biopolymer transport system component